MSYADRFVVLTLETGGNLFVRFDAIHAVVNDHSATTVSAVLVGGEWRRVTETAVAIFSEIDAAGSKASAIDG